MILLLCFLLDYFNYSGYSECVHYGTKANVKLELVDSIRLFNKDFQIGQVPEGSTIIYTDTNIFLSNLLTNKLWIFDKKGKVISSFSVTFKNGNAFRIYDYCILSNTIYFINYNIIAIWHLGSNNVKIVKLNRKFAGNELFFANLYSRPGLLIKGDQLILPANSLANCESDSLSLFFNLNYYSEQNTLFVRCNFSEHVDSLYPDEAFGHYDVVYREKRFIPHLSDLFWAMDTTGNCYLDEEGTYKIKVFNKNGAELRSFGSPGKWLAPSDTIMSFTSEAKGDLLSYTIEQYQILNPEYEDISLDTLKHLIYRKYKAGIDGVDAKEVFKCFNYSKLRDMLFSKACFLQVYNSETGTLLYDEPMPNDFKIVYANDGYIIGSTKIVKEGEMTLYKYRVVEK